MFGKLDEMPILFEEVFLKEGTSMPKASTAEDKVKILGDGHLFVFVHGYQGNQYDTRLMKNVTFLRLPGCQLLCSSVNESQTEGDIQVMGDRLAREIVDFIKEWFPGASLRKISLVGHSMGGVIIRAALPHLAEYKDKMQTLMTFSSPHLGCMYQGSTLVSWGMSALKSWHSSTSLGQLQMKDSKTYTDTFMYKLSLAPVLP